MLATKYRLLGRVMDGVKVTDYEVEDIVNGEHFVLPRQRIEDLALEKLIVNCTAQRHNGRVILKGSGCKLSQLPYVRKDKTVTKKVNSYKITGRIVQGKYVIGYRIEKGSTGELFNVKREMVISMIRNGDITNARVQSSNGTGVIVRGIGCDISKLPVLRISKEELK